VLKPSLTMSIQVPDIATASATAVLGAVGHLGDLAVVIPLTLLTSVFVWRYASAQAALQLAVCCIGCLSVLAAMKLILIGCAPAWQWTVVSPSGHAGAASFVYGAMAMVMASTAASPKAVSARAWPVAAGLLVAGIAASRVVLGMHNAAEVAVGLAVGAVALLLFGVGYLRAPARSLPVTWLAGLAAAIAVAAYGSQTRAEPRLRELAFDWRDRIGICQMTHPQSTPNAVLGGDTNQ
jgi:membrane-associated phospholipid phosphatase